MDESMIFYSSFYEAIDGFGDEEQLTVLKAIIEYGLYGKVPDLRGAQRGIFRIAKPLIDANKERRENGKKGGRKKSEVSKPKTIGFENTKNEKPMVSTLKTYGFENENHRLENENHRLEKSEPNVNVNVNANVNTSSSSRARMRENEDFDDGVWNPDELITTTDGTQIRLGDVHFGNTVKIGKVSKPSGTANHPPLTEAEKERILNRLEEFKKKQAGG